MIKEIEPIPAKMIEALQKGYPTATDLADYFVTNLNYLKTMYFKIPSACITRVT